MKKNLKVEMKILRKRIEINQKQVEEKGVDMKEIE